MYPFQDKQNLGQWNAANKPLVARTFNGGQSYYLVQQESYSPDTFVVRGRNLLLSASVTMAQGVPRSAYSDLAGGDTDADGLFSPPFPTPSGYVVKTYSDGTVYFQQSGNADCQLSDGLNLGTFNPTNQPIEAYFNNGKWYVIQVVNRNPMEFVVRGKNVLRGYFATASRPNCIDAIDSEETGNSGSYTPPSFQTPQGFKRDVYSDNTTYFKKVETSTGAPTPVVSVEGVSLNADGTYHVQQDQTVTLKVANVQNHQWRIRLASSNFDDYALEQSATYAYKVSTNGIEVYVINRTNTNQVATTSNFIKFTIDNPAQAQKSAKPQVAKTDVIIGQPAVVTSCSGAQLTIAKVNGDQEFQAAFLSPTAPGGTVYEVQLGALVYAWGNNISVGDKLNIRQTCPGQTLSDPVTITVAGIPNDVCANMGDRTVIGYSATLNAALICRQFNNKLWVVQRVSVSPDAFVLRGRNILLRDDVSSNYKGCIDRLTGDTGAGGLLGFPQPDGFETPAGYEKKVFVNDGTPYYQEISNTPNIPTPEILSGDTIAVGGTIKGRVGTPGTVKVYADGGNFVTDITGVQNDFSYVASYAGNFTFRLETANGLSSVSIIVKAGTGGISTGPCSVNDKQEVGLIDGKKLIARRFNGLMWLTQQTQTNPDQFVVRGANLIEQSNVISTFKECKSSFSGGDTGVGGLAIPNTFTTPDGYVRKEFSDKTPYFEALVTTGGGGDTGGGGGGGGGGTPVVDTTKASAIFTIVVQNSCGTEIEYAVHKTATEGTSSLLSWQPSNEFLLNSGLYNVFFREKGKANTWKMVPEQLTA